MVGQLTRVELNLHQMGLTSLVSAPENLANSGGRNALRSKQVAFNQASFKLILPLTALQTSSCAPDCLCPGFGGQYWVLLMFWSRPQAQLVLARMDYRHMLQWHQ